MADERHRHRDAPAGGGDLPAVQLRLPRLRAALAEAPRAACAASGWALPTISALQERCCTTPAAFAQLLQFLTIPVSEMFRDPAYFLALRRQVVPLLRTYPSLKIWVAGCSTGEEVVFAGHPAARGRPARAHASSTRPTSTRRRWRRRAQGIFPLERDAALHRQLPEGRRPARFSRLLHGGLRRRAVRPRAARERHLRRPQPGHRQRVRRDAAGLAAATC